MKLILSVWVLIVGVVGVVFNRALTESMRKYYSHDDFLKFRKRIRIGYIVVGIWMIVLSSAFLLGKFAR